MSQTKPFQLLTFRSTRPFVRTLWICCRIPEGHYDPYRWQDLWREAIDGVRTPDYVSPMTDQELKDLVAETTRNVATLIDDNKQTDRQLKETDRELKEMGKATDRQLKESAKETDRLSEETFGEIREMGKETDRRLRLLVEQLDGLGNKFGSFTEGLDYRSLYRILTEDFHRANVAYRCRRRRDGTEQEFDLVGSTNGAERGVGGNQEPLDGGRTQEVREQVAGVSQILSRRSRQGALRPDRGGGCRSRVDFAGGAAWPLPGGGARRRLRARLARSRTIRVTSYNSSIDSQDLGCRVCGLKMGELAKAVELGHDAVVSTNAKRHERRLQGQRREPNA
jgi:hypothetical protein